MMSYYLLTLGSVAPKISYRCDNQRLFTALSSPTNGEDEFKFTRIIDPFKKLFKQATFEHFKFIIEQLLSIF